MQPDAAEIQQLFDRIAPLYDRLNDSLSFGTHRIWKQMAVNWSGAKTGDRVVDVCCGSGDIALLLAEVVGKTGTVVGIDFSAVQLDVARRRSHQQLRPVDWVQGDALNLPFEENTFDAATMSYGLRNLTDIPQGLGELYRILKPGAAVAILDMHRPQSAGMRAFQQWYLNTLVVPTAQRFRLKEEYAYIAPSLDRFPSGRQQVQLAQSTGFERVVHYPLMGGMMGVLVAHKP
nr:bifunctional demethylmenaquinone methyltransferase/2-methoxy-6-polyprenyl-1,4-benzoquinol methylase UbiE [Sodalinema gerasimenkoae]